MPYEDVRAARTEIMEIMKSICESDANVTGVLLVDARNDLITLQYIRKDQTRETSTKRGLTELGGGVLGRLIPALENLCLEGGLNIGSPLVTVVLAQHGTAIIHLITHQWALIAFGKMEMNVTHVAQQIIRSRSRFQTLIEKAKLGGEAFEEWSF